MPRDGAGKGSLFLIGQEEKGPGPAKVEKGI